MGVLALLGRLVSNNPLVLIVAGPQSSQFNAVKGEDRYSLHFFTQKASHFAILFAGVTLLLLISVSGQAMRYIVESTIVFVTCLLTYICVSMGRSQVKHDVILALMIAVLLITDQSQRHKWDLNHFSLSSHVITFMFTLTGLRRTGLVLIWAISEVIRLTVSAASNDWRSLLTSVIKDVVCLAYGLCVYFCIYYVGTEILRFRFRPRLALQDFVGLPLLEYRTFAALKETFDPSFPTLTENDNINVLLQMPQIVQTRETILRTLGGDAGARKKYFGPGTESLRLSGEVKEPSQLMREKQEALKSRLQQINTVTRKMDSQGRSRGGILTPGGGPPGDGEAAAGDRRLRTRQKTVTFGGQKVPAEILDAAVPTSGPIGQEASVDRFTASESEVQQTKKEMQTTRTPSDLRPDRTVPAGDQILEAREAKAQEMKIRRKKRRARSLAIRGNASAFLVHSNPTAGLEHQTKPHSHSHPTTSPTQKSAHKSTAALVSKVASVPDKKGAYGMGLGGRQGIIIRGSLPLFLTTRKSWVERVFPFILDSATEAVVQEANWRKDPPQLNTDIFFGRFTDVKVERWYLSWRAAAITRLFFVSYQWLMFQQILTLIVAAGAADGMLFAAWVRNSLGVWVFV
eukprot:Gregarina_sp_Poly_1__1162@NODE_1284_length_4497_cov_74_202257_g6_i1_p1_GENE_NODE_1284_length_4497_cov_74_202257_g6_i1NODE_1284_length_4497_cov_74_202257_g6_i1_p1_ORF_typecomplete_len629_score90_32AC_N/PF16214_5/0_033AC_N/PF16214_5/4_7e03MTBP_C/PF14920_6/1e04MTBP_C/PF14920_6/0_51_NODE_1284_length_4497_cov_74_202257_g6_i17242610